MADKFAKARMLWQRYYDVTTELLKFIKQDKIDEFLELVDQRTELLAKLEALPDTEYRKTEECQALFDKIKPLDMQAIYLAKSWLNKSKRQNSSVKSYDLMAKNAVGRIFNKQL